MKLNIKYKNKTRKNRITRKQNRGKNKGRRTRAKSKRQGGMFRRFAKNVGKTALDVTTDVLTEVSKDQVKQLSKKAVTSFGKASAANSFKSQYSFNNNDFSFKNKPQFVNPYDVKSEKDYKINIDDMIGSPTTPTKKPYFDEDVLNAPMKEKPGFEGSVTMRNADLTQVKKQLF